MADIDAGGAYAPDGPRSVARTMSSALGALTALAAAGAVAWWGWGVGQRDLSQIPVVHALDGPAKRRPASDGGEVLTDDQRAVGAMMEGEGRRTAYAPATEGLAPEDRPWGLLPDRPLGAPESGSTRRPPAPSAPMTAAPGAVMTEAPALAGPRGPSLAPETGRSAPDLSALGRDAPLRAPGTGGIAPAIGPSAEQAFARAEAERLAQAERAEAARRLAENGAAARAAAEAEAARRAAELEAARAAAEKAAAAAAALAPRDPVDPEDARTEAPRFAPVSPGRPDAATRAAALRAAKEAEAKEAAAAAAVVLTKGDPAIQLGAFESPEVAESEWRRLSGRHDDLIGAFAHAVTPVNSGGRTLWRLRAGPLDSLDASRNLCAAFKTRRVPCVPARAE